MSRSRAAEDEVELRRVSVRLGLQIGGLLLAVLAVVSALVVVVVISGQQRQTSATLDQAIAVSRGDGGGRRPDADDAEIRDVAVAVSDPRGFRVDGAMPAGLPDRAVMTEVARSGRTDERRVRVASGRYVVRTAQHGDDTIQAVLSLREESEELTRLLQALLIGGGIGVVLVAGVAALLSRRAVRPMATALTLQRRFVADAAHELRTPLTLLSTRAQLLGRRLDRDASGTDDAARATVRADVRGLVDDSADLAAILEDLLLAADRTAVLPSVPVDLADVVGSATAAAQVTADQARIRLTSDVTGPDTVVPAGSRPALLRVVHALIDNAISHARSEVTVTVGADARAVELRVVDDGPGVDPQVASTLFERFATRRPAVDGETRRHYGLGLALVGDVAARHGGTVEVRRRPDGHSGAAFVVRLPRKP